ncbi:MAG: rod shape-determining protein RodA [Parachlamydiaceae bacterium]|nr:rod shape-determining protein RodA [Parachlamydiaceae bacterium]
MIWSYRHLLRIDFRVIPVLIALLFVSLITISAYSTDGSPDALEGSFFTPAVNRQIKGVLLGIGAFIFFAGFDYNKLREWTWLLYILMLFFLVGLFFTDSIQRVHRWYRLPLIGMNFQPSEYAKLVVVIALSWFLERRSNQTQSVSTAFFALLIVAIPFALILKQPDLGTALVLFPISLVMFYFGDIHPWVLKTMSTLAICILVLVALIFAGIVSHEQIRPHATKVLKAYQFDRLDPNTHHQKAAATSIAIGGLTGKGWRNSEYASGGWLPEAYTDSVFPAFAEEFGFAGSLFVIILFYALLYFSFQVTAVASTHFGRLLSAGITVYLAMHILVNIGMMCGLLPITGVPLVLISYGGTSILSTMTALGILQSIYSRRFMF